MLWASKIKVISGAGFRKTKNQRRTQVKNWDIFEDIFKELTFSVFFLIYLNYMMI